MSFPLVVHVAPNVWSGFIDIQSSSSAFPVQQFQIRIAKDPHDTAFKSRRLHASVPGFDVDSRLLQMLAPHSAALQRAWRNAMVNEAAFLSTFLSDVSDLIEKALDHEALGSASSLAAPSHEHYECVLKEIEAIGWNCVVAADASLTNLTLDISDSTQQTRSVQVQLPASYPQTAPVIRLQAPVEFNGLQWTPTSNLSTVVSALIQFFDDLSAFFSACEDIDHHCVVLEPELPNFIVSYRRIALGNHCSMLITMDPRRPLQRCSIRLSGSDAVVAPLEARWAREQHYWNEDELPRSNLQRILGLEFPSKRDVQENESISVECGICYAFLVNQAVPELICENTACGRCFHSACLFNWLQALPSTRHSYQTLFGQCPYCSNSITVTAPHKT